MKIKLPHRRGIPIQTRIIVSVIMLLLQLSFFILLVYNISANSFGFYLLSEVVAVATVIYIVNRRGNPSHKMMWLAFILLVPIFGLSVFFLFGGGRILPHIRKKMQRCEEHFMPALSRTPNVLSGLEYDDRPHARQADYLMRESGYPLYKNTSVEYLSPGEKFYPRFLQELQSAQKYIFIEFFILAEGVMWDGVYEILKRKVSEGVDVRVLFDDFGSIKRQRKGFIKTLREAGIKVAVFNKIKPSINIFMNNRNHRKIVVIDGKVAATGGINIADEYINEFERFGYWLDSAVIIKGEAVKSFIAMFCSTWEFATGERLFMGKLICDYSVKEKSYVLPYCDDPINDKNPAEGIYMQIINTALKYVYITTPYLIIDSTMTEVLCLAAKSGIDVRIITPHIPDKWYVHPVTQYNYYELLKSGVRIFEYTPGFIHSKTFVSDDTVATVGTVNMDYRSFITHFECGVWFSGNEAVAEVKKDFENALSVSEEITIEAWKKAPLWQKIKRAILRIFAPFM